MGMYSTIHVKLKHIKFNRETSIGYRKYFLVEAQQKVKLQANKPHFTMIYHLRINFLVSARYHLIRCFFDYT